VVNYELITYSFYLYHYDMILLYVEIFYGGEVYEF